MRQINIIIILCLSLTLGKRVSIGEASDETFLNHFESALEEATESNFFREHADNTASTSHLTEDINMFEHLELTPDEIENLENYEFSMQVRDNHIPHY